MILRSKLNLCDREINTAAVQESSSPLLGDVFALPYPGVLEVVAELVPEHEDVIRSHLFLPSLWLYTKVAHRILETGRGNKAEAQKQTQKQTNKKKKGK